MTLHRRQQYSARKTQCGANAASVITTEGTVPSFIMDRLASSSMWISQDPKLLLACHELIYGNVGREGRAGDLVARGLIKIVGQKLAVAWLISQFTASPTCQMYIHHLPVIFRKLNSWSADRTGGHGAWAGQPLWSRNSAPASAAPHGLLVRWTHHTLSAHLLCLLSC